MARKKQSEGDLVTRYEAKYIVPSELVPRIREFIRPFCQGDPHAHGDPPGYTITTLQLEDPFYSLHNAKEFSALNRFKLRVRYNRESYVGSVDSYARITFDSALQYQMTDSGTDFGRGGLWRGMDSAEAQGFGLPYSGVVLEVKTLSHTPVWAIDLVERFNLQKSGNCKYSTAIWRDSLVHSFPGTNSAAEEALILALA